MNFTLRSIYVFRFFCFCFVGSSLFLGNMGTYSGQILLNRLWLFRVSIMYTWHLQYRKKCFEPISFGSILYWYFSICLIFCNFWSLICYMLHIIENSYLTSRIDWFCSWWIFKICFRYSVIRFEEYFARKNEFLSLQWIFPSKSSWKSWCTYNIAIFKRSRVPLST